MLLLPLVHVFPCVICDAVGTAGDGSRSPSPLFVVSYLSVEIFPDLLLCTGSHVAAAMVNVCAGRTETMLELLKGH